MAGVNDENKIVVVKGLMAAVNCPWRRGRAAVKSNPSTTSMKRNRAKRSNFAWHYKSKALFGKKQDDVGKLTGKPIKSISPLMEGDADEGASQMQMVLWNEGDAYDNDGQLQNDLQLIKKWHNLSLPPFGAACSSDKGARIKVRETLRLYQAIVRKLLQEEEAKSMSKENSIRRIDLLAGKILKDKGKYVNTGKQILGPVPGVEVGDEFHYRVELMIIGLHRPLQSGIDYLKVGKKIIATSIVASGGYANDVDSSDVLIYTGQGGNATGGDKQPEDQKLERGNLALKNSIEERNFVRVIRGFKDTKFSEFGDGRGKVVATYTYDGLYIVKKYWQDIGPHGKMVYKFELRRVPGQSDLSWKHVKSKKFKAREGRCVDDISEGKEVFPICAVNTIDNEKPPKFTYVTRMVFPDWYHSIPPRGCDCVNGCSDSEKCACAVRNGGEIPYNYNGAIVEAKPLVYECGPCCRCPPSCHNRVSQHGIKFQLEIFKTESRGWGVRSLSSIPSGSFICEYLGELLEDKEAEQRTGSDEYLFDIGQNYNDRALWDGLSTIMPDAALSASEVVEEGFTIDAAKYGNVGRFINHSCSPNLYAQNVLYDNDDKRIPHIMLFAAENIPPLQEMTYHYNYTIDESALAGCTDALFDVFHCAVIIESLLCDIGAFVAIVGAVFPSLHVFDSHADVFGKQRFLPNGGR
ncbi:hypothetical protein Nepgr_030673 [Nepenthes gracilis]|uniref:Uncharacterized protein n=1 Tax=Nepenthes gracilis TaxID=150966 RepID=A0AAD3Y614_NEPGR|nr:hypothetical protein Nepgr_030673 [Nepenthes gracilis]